jgi:SAM-dependent methyltransferase
MGLREKFIATIYTTHNQSYNTKKALKKIIEYMEGVGQGLNVGAGDTYYHKNIINLDIKSGPNINICGQAEFLPFHDSSLAIIMSQEVLEHVEEYNSAINEMYRVLKKGGLLYLQLPFILGFHSGPHDYLRFTIPGIRSLVTKAGFSIEEIEMATGPAMGFYRVSVEFIAILFTRFIPAAYYLMKGIASLILYPIQLLDNFLQKSEQAYKIAGGFYVIARK